MVPIGYGNAEVTPDELPGREETEDPEMIRDIAELLRRKSTAAMPLADLFRDIMQGTGTRAQREKFGYTRADEGRKIILKTIEEYANKTQNWHLLRLLDRFKDFRANRPDPASEKPKPKKPPSYRATMSPDEADYKSIVDVLERNGRSGSMALFGGKRSRWLGRKPRDPNSPHPNRLADVLANMVRDGVLNKVGVRYSPGVNYGKYLDTPAAAAVTEAAEANDSRAEMDAEFAFLKRRYGLHKLKLRYDPAHLKKVESEAYFDPENFEIALKDDHISKKKLIALLHEFGHVLQFMQDDLTINKRDTRKMYAQERDAECFARREYEKIYAGKYGSCRGDASDLGSYDDYLDFFKKTRT